VRSRVELRCHALVVEIEVAADFEHRLARELGLGREEGVVVLPEASLGGRRLAGLGRQRRQGVALGNRQVAEGEDEALAEAVANPAQDRLGAEAEGALEVAEHDQLQRPAELAAKVVFAVQRGSQPVVHATRCYVLMGNVEYVLLLLIGAALLVRVAELGKVPAPIVLVLGGLGLALVPGVKTIELEPDVVFLVFLPPLVYAAGWRTSPHELRALVRPLGLLALGLVFVTAAVVAVVAHALVPGLGWAGAAVLGAVLAPTDAVAATSIFRRLGAPERVRLLVEGESMINDGTALVIYRIAVGVAAGGAFSVGGAALEFVAVAAGGALAGLAVGVLSDLVVRRQNDSGLVIVITVLTAYSAYVGAEAIHVSGILAAVVAGLYAGYQAPRSLDADTRLSAVAFWGVSVFALEIALFVLLGLQLPTIVDALEQSSSGVGELLLPAAAIAAASIGARLAYVFAMGSDAGDTAGQRFAVGWSGMRGAVSLAAALAVPLDVPGRPQIVFLSFALILVTLVGQGLSLPFAIRALRLEEARRWSDEEAVARMEAAQAALDRIDEIEDEGRAPASHLARLRDLYRARFRMCQAVLGGEDPGAARREQRIADYGTLRRELIGIERETLLALRGTGRLPQGVMRQIERDLDLEEARIRT
jgi:monovalent cation/hydrogen antiporter